MTALVPARDVPNHSSSACVAMSASEPIELFDMRGVANVRKISSKEEAEDLLLGRPYGTYDEHRWGTAIRPWLAR